MTIRKFIAFIFVIMLFANSALASHQCCKVSNDDAQKIGQMDCHKKADDNKAEKQISKCQCGSNVTAYHVEADILAETTLNYSINNSSEVDSIISAYINPIDAPPKHNS